MKKRFSIKSIEEVRREKTPEPSIEAHNAIDNWVSNKDQANLDSQNTPLSSIEMRQEKTIKNETVESCFPEMDLSDIKLKENTKRLTVDLPESLLRTLKKSCAEDGVTVKDRVISILENNLHQ